MGFLKSTLLIATLLLICVSVNALPRIAYSGASLVLPGSGEMLMGHNTRGATLMGVDLIAIYAFFATGREVKRQEDNYMMYANLYAGVPYDMPDNHYQAVQDYISSDYINDLAEMVGRNYYLITNYDPQEYAVFITANTYTGIEAWQWQSETQWNEYKSMRSRTQRIKMSHNLALGIMLMNRAVSAIDSALLYRKNNQEQAIYFSPSGDTGIMLNYCYRFK